MKIEDFSPYLYGAKVGAEEFPGLPIIDKDGREIFFRPNAAQEKALQRMREQDGKPLRVVVLKNRQVGFSTFFLVMMTAYAHAFPHRECYLIAQRTDTAKTLHERCLKMWVALYHRSMKKGTTKTILFDHGNGANSFIRSDTAGALKGGRGPTAHALLLTEASRYPFGAIAAFTSAVSYSPETMILIETTANGKTGQGEAYYKLYMSALEEKSDYIPVFIPWTLDASCVRPVDSEFSLIDEDEEMLHHEMGLTFEQIAFRRSKIEGEYSGDVNLFQQEYPLCLTGDTLVSTEKGIIRIEDAGGCRQSESGMIQKWGPQPISRIWKVKTRYGRELKGTSDHPVMTKERGFVPLADLLQGEEIILRNPRFSDTPYVKIWNPIPGSELKIEIDERWGRFLGYYMGDGSFYSGRVEICCDAQDEDIVRDVSRLMESLIGPTSLKKIQRIKGRKGAVVVFSQLPKSLWYLFEDLGLIKRNWQDSKRCGPFKSQTLNKAAKRIIHVPKCILRSPKYIVAEFLKGLFEADGSASGNAIRVGSSYKEFMQEVQLLLLGFGIFSSISKNIKRSASKKEYQLFPLVLSMSSVDIFRKEIGFIGQRKNEKIQRMKSGKKGHHLSMGEGDYVVSIEDTGIDEITYDFTIEEAHCFSANGILTHNTEEEAFISSGYKMFFIDELKSARSGIEKPRQEGEFVIDPSSKKYLSYIPKRGGYLKIWESPDPDSRYYLGADAAKCEDIESDFAAAVLWNGTHKRQAARISARIDPVNFALVLNLLGRWYNNAMLIIELTGGWGNHTQQVIRDEWGYPNLYRWKGRNDRVKNQMSNAYGWETTHRSRQDLMSVFKSGIREDGLLIKDEALVVQMENAEQEFGNWDVTYGNDDILMAGMIGWMACFHYPAPVFSGARTKVLDDLPESPVVLPPDQAYMMKNLKQLQKLVKKSTGRLRKMGGPNTPGNLLKKKIL